METIKNISKQKSSTAIENAPTKKYYLPTDENWDSIFCREFPVCMDEAECDRLIEASDGEMDDSDFYVADEEDIERFGVYDSPWYAITINDNDWNWKNGSYNLSKALVMAYKFFRKHNDCTIQLLTIEGYKEPVCIRKEIIYSNGVKISRQNGTEGMIKFKIYEITKGDDGDYDIVYMLDTQWENNVREIDEKCESEAEDGFDKYTLRAFILHIPYEFDELIPRTKRGINALKLVQMLSSGKIESPDYDINSGLCGKMFFCRDYIVR